MSHPAIVVMSGAEAGTVLTIDEVLNDFSIGSDEGCHLVVSGAAVSPMHASVFLDDEGQITISDTNSQSGVFINGVRVMEHALAEGDQISLGPPDQPGSDLLSFSAHGADAPLVDFGESDSAGISGLDLEPIQLEAPLLTSELGRPDFEAPSGGLGSLASPELSLQDMTPLEALPDAAPSILDQFPPPEALADPGPELPVSETAPAPARVAPPRPRAPAPAAPRVAPAGTPKAATPASGSARRSAAPSDGDPLAGLAESLGATSGGRLEPPPPVPEAPATHGLKSSKASPAIMAVRLAIVAVVLAGLAWFGLRKYSDSIVVPIVDSYQPDPAEPGQTVTITGSGFGAVSDPTLVKVALGSTNAPVLDGNPTRLNIKIPESLGDAGSQILPLTVTADGSSSVGRPLKIAVTPKVASLTPRVALSGDEVVIAGRWLANAKVRPKVTVAGNDAEILEATPASIRIKVPQVAATEGQKVSVRVAVGPDVSKDAPLHYGRLPFVDTLSPERAFPGDVVTISGLGLAGPGLSVVVGGRNAVVLASTDAELKISVPGLRLLEGPGRRDLRVQTDQKFSIVHPLEILRESSALYSPRFFAEVIEGGRVAVSNELGPVMLLGSDAPSKKRAHDAAVRLNALVSQGRTNRVQFSAADVSINGPGGAVLTLAAGDGAGNPRALAGLWAAELTDVFDLFLQGRRPGRTVEVSPDGKVFLDIFASARRRSSEPGVSQGLLSSPDPAWSRSLAALASSPALSSSQATALLDGYWSGAIEVPGAIQARKIEISLTVTPSGLVGQRTSRQGRLSTDVTLGNLSYSKRELRFSFVDSGDRLNYAGRLDGDVIDGNVTKASGARVGKLTLKLTR